jgi:alkylation response protein AidB-like acyl-CoA dehydrogenase
VVRRCPRRTWAEETIAIAGAAGIEGRPVVIGHSMGGWVAPVTGAEHGDALTGVITIDSPGQNPPPKEVAATSRSAFRPLRRYPSFADAITHSSMVPDQVSRIPYVFDHIAHISGAERNGVRTWRFDLAVFTRDRPVTSAVLSELRCPFAVFGAEHGIVPETSGRSSAKRPAGPRPWSTYRWRDITSCSISPCLCWWGCARCLLFGVTLPADFDRTRVRVQEERMVTSRAAHSPTAGSLESLRRELKALVTGHDSSQPPDRDGPAVWRYLVSGGWCDERESADGHRATALLYAELGRTLVSTPHLSSVVLARPLLRAAHVPGDVIGSLTGAVVSVALGEPGRRRWLDGWASRLEAGSAVIRKTFVPDLALADFALVGLITRGEPALALVPAADVRDSALPLPALSQEPLFLLEADALPIDPSWVWPTSRRALVDALRPAAAATAAAAAGAALQCIELTVGYVNQRQAFGQPVGSFQAVQHQLAGLYTDATAAERLAHYAAWALDVGSGQATRLCASAILFAAQTFNAVAARCLRFHGGNGYLLTSQMPAFYRRAKAWQLSLGGPDFWQDVLADAIAQDPTLSDEVV